MQKVIPIELESVFQSIRDNNQFTLFDGIVVWESDWHDSEMTPVINDRITWVDGDGRLAYDDVDGWYIKKRDGEDVEDDTVFTFEKPFYEFGSIPEIVDIVNGEFGIKKNTSFPLAALATIDQSYTEDDLDEWAEYDFVMYLCIKADPDWRPKERYVNSYQEVLNPMWDLIKRYLEYSTYFLEDEQLTFRERWGENGLYGRENNTFNDMVDALEINLTLKYNNYGNLCSS